MWWENKMMRTFRVRLKQKPGVIGHLLAAIGEVRGLIGEIKTIQMGSAAVVRDIVVFADTPEHMHELMQVVRNDPHSELIEVRDDVLEMHQGGKIAVTSRYKIDTLSQLRRVYTPGVAEVCLKIKDNPEVARRFTSISHLVAIVTDGTAVLGLGDIGPQASMPVMEGKAALMSCLVGLSGMPILLGTKDVDTIVETIVQISPTFSAIQLEDISAPRCFDIEDRLKERLDIPVMHDDQHGTAVVVTAGLINAAKMADVSLKSEKIGVIGLGAAGMAISKMMMHLYGKATLGADIAEHALARLKKEGGIPSTLEEIMSTCKVVIATTGVPGLIKPEMVRPGQIIFALSNPTPEIEPEEALEAGAVFAADGKSVNNILGFPGIFRGAVDANVNRITNEMLVAAAKAIADIASPGEIVPSPVDRDVHKNVARAVALTALQMGMNREDLSHYFDD
ncbi:MAG: NAD-dependent malic enzyme [Acidobacteria bacterium]|nr:NAD-dependent malic enzyme [Acidobacteriota bacterium]MBU1475435.1 NAD-dependent malic enzyme [Acidobacteriota bacterium]MBU2437803.1 NAD-dependent malic enzyme [Acidobacteriota bacterium]